MGMNEFSNAWGSNRIGSWGYSFGAFSKESHFKVHQGRLAGKMELLQVATSATEVAVFHVGASNDGLNWDGVNE